MADGRVKEVKVDSRINKVLSLRTDSMPMLEALDSISNFYVSNTLEARRSLRQDLEYQNIALAKKFLAEFDEVKCRLEAAEEYSVHLENACRRLADRVAEADENMKAFMSKASELELERNGLLEQSKEIQTFLSKFQLSEEEIEILHSTEIDSPKSAKAFFSALQRLQTAYSECKDVVEKHCFTAGFELLDMLGQHQETAYQRLYEWVKAQCANLSETVNDDDSDVLLQVAIRHLRKVPAYYAQCQDLVVTSRRAYLVQKFVAALTQGSGTGSQSVLRAIDMHAHDAVRYVGDMLAWMHQAVASEEEFLQSVFGQSPSNGAGGSSSPTEKDEVSASNDLMGLSVPELLSRCLQGLGRPLRTRVQQTLESRAGLDVLYTLTDLLTFYEATFRRLVPQENSVHSAVKGCLLESKRLFLGLLNKQAEAMTQTAVSYPLDLSASLLTKECCKQIQEVLRVYQEALSPLPTEDPSDGCHINAVLGNIIQPLLQACRMTGQGLPPADSAVFMLNCVSAIQNELKESTKRGHTGGMERTTQRLLDSHVSAAKVSNSNSEENSAVTIWLELLSTEAEIWVGVLVGQETSRTLHRSDMDKLVELLEVLPESIKASEQPGLGQDRVATILRAFYSSLLSTIAPQFEKLQDPDLRELTRVKSAAAIANAYELVYNVVSNPFNGYNASVLSHTVDEVKVLLGCQV